jgi:hypothetical protein
MAGELARVVSDHMPMNDGNYTWPKVCSACSEAWPCHSFQRQLQGQSDNRADRMRAHMTLWSLRMLSRPELAFIGPQVSAQLLDWIDGAVAAQEAVDRARKAVQLRAQSAASRFADHAFTAAGRFMPLSGSRHFMDHIPRPYAHGGPAPADPDPTSADGGGPDGTPNRSRSGAGWARVGRWRLGRGHQRS